MGNIYSLYRGPLAELDQYMDIINNISYTLYTYKVSPVDSEPTKSELAGFTTHFRVNERRVESDLKYFYNQVARESEVLEKVLSGFELYGALHGVFAGLGALRAAGLRAGDAPRVELMREALRMRNESSGVDRCTEGEWVCRVRMGTDLVGCGVWLGWVRMGVGPVEQGQVGCVSS